MEKGKWEMRQNNMGNRERENGELENEKRKSGKRNKRELGE